MPGNPPKPIIGHGVLFAEHKAIVYGGPKTYKSIFVQQLGFCIVNGAPFMDIKTQQSRVLYIQSEISRWLFNQRVLKMGMNMSVAPRSYFLSTEFHLKLDKQDGLVELHKVVDKVKPDVLILDPLYKLISSPDELSILRAIDSLDSILERHHCAVVIVHHSRKPKTTATGSPIDLGGAELRGPLLEGWADSLLRIRGDPTTLERTLEFELRHSTTQLPRINMVLDQQRLWIDRVI